MFSFIGLSMDRNFALGWKILRASPTSDLDDLNDETWNFLS